MGHYRYLVFTNPTEGHEAEFNTWYDEVHLGEVLAVPGFIGAERYRIEAAEAEHRYLAIYEFEADDPAAVLGELPARVADGRIGMPPVLDANIKTVLYKVITPRVTR
jgi:hypothetical protein